MPGDDRRVCIVGAGRVGSTLALALQRGGYRIVGVASRGEQSARRLGERLGCPFSVRPEQFTPNADVVLVTTSDREIAAVAARIQSRGGFTAGQLVAHTSGATPAEALAPAREAGAVVASIHPLQSFADADAALERLPGCYFGVEGDAAGVFRARRLVEDLGGVPLEVNAGDKALYHAAACVASNYLVAVIHLATELLGRCGWSRTDALKALGPLIDGTRENVRDFGVVGALTGPVVRNDRPTLEWHLAALTRLDAGYEGVYRALGVYTAGIAREQGALSASQARELASLFEGVLDRG
ncbi:Rossmann-like and DUF2520 domain-containing protein [Candidatus Desulforudis audaxviator]|uniref:Oxidoreductase domain protein n=1 Tax=Desulforudis audaxviator (strain MP104C) TaxID=477974 RepID=B1I1N6_DESAP|nr:DUF2520 domain-containing protein [Candidatus Desulforudis audaxviator]ACA58667.1 oxidoreductase domain protein [Candidatus Desulforudis audaxviator MP104C]AZK58667.1 Ketopantoate reductase PanG [Candidatus Desulforudis audaxviator]